METMETLQTKFIEVAANARDWHGILNQNWAELSAESTQVSLMDQIMIAKYMDERQFYMDKQINKRGK